MSSCSSLPRKRRPWTPTKTPLPPLDSIHIVAQNVRKMVSYHRYLSFFQKFALLPRSVFLLSELHCDESRAKHQVAQACLQLNVGHSASIFTASTTTSSAAIILGGDLACRIMRRSSHGTYAISLTLGTGNFLNGGITFVAIHCPPQWTSAPNHHRAQISNLVAFLNEEIAICKRHNWYITIGGDFNMLASPIDAHPSHNLQGKDKSIHTALTTGDLSDIYRSHFPVTKGWTRLENIDNVNKGARLDYLYACPQAFDLLTPIERQPGLPWSDHFAVTATLTPPQCLQ
jgi:exonuclease III